MAVSGHKASEMHYYKIRRKEKEGKLRMLGSTDEIDQNVVGQNCIRGTSEMKLALETQIRCKRAKHKSHRAYISNSGVR